MLTVRCRYGVSAEPEFQSVELRAGDRIVIASDGLWDVMENDEVSLLSSYRSSASLVVLCFCDTWLYSHFVVVFYYWSVFVLAFNVVVVFSIAPQASAHKRY